MSQNKKHNKQKQENKKDIRFKVQMYFISLMMLFALITPIAAHPIRDEDICGKNLKEFIIVFLKTNYLLLICIALIIVAYILLKQLEFRWNGARDLSVKIIEVDEQNYEYLTFLTTYIIPLACLNFDEVRYVIVLFILLVLIGFIFVQSEFYLGNPTLALLQYRLYRVKYMLNGETYEKLVITKDRLNVDDYIEAIPFDDHSWYVRRNTRHEGADN